MPFCKKLVISTIAICISACTSGHLEYLTPNGERKTACEVEYTWLPSVDKYAVEYILSYCAKQAVERGNTVVNEELLKLDLTVPEPPQEQVWTHELARSLHEEGKLSDKEYGYLIAYLDLGHDKKNIEK